MESDDTPRPGQSRLSDVGDYEVFDGERWRPVAPLLADPEDGNREGRDVRDSRRADAASRVPVDTVADSPSDVPAELATGSPGGGPAGGPAEDHRDFLRDGPGGTADLPSDR